MIARRVIKIERAQRSIDARWRRHRRWWRRRGGKYNKKFGGSWSRFFANQLTHERYSSSFIRFVDQTHLGSMLRNFFFLVVDINFIRNDDILIFFFSWCHTRTRAHFNLMLCVSRWWLVKRTVRMCLTFYWLLLHGTMVFEGEWTPIVLPLTECDIFWQFRESR